MSSSFMDRFRSFFGIRQEVPRNDFRNPIWGSDDDDDDDELYNKQASTIFNDPIDVHRQFAEQMNKMVQVFGNMFGDMSTFFPNEGNFDSFARITEIPAESESFGMGTENIRDYYLKPGYQSPSDKRIQEDVNLDGKISSQDISGLLNSKQDENNTIMKPFRGNFIGPGKSFCQTIITTSVTKPDGTIETRRIVKNGHDVVEETTTTSVPDMQNPSSGLDSVSNHSIIFNNLIDLFTYFRNFN